MKGDGVEKARRASSPIRFGIFEADLASGELRKHGEKIKLQDQPFQVLAALLERPGELVTRDELQQKVWASDTFVDFERGLNKAINRLREALGDSAENPAFIETLPRRGYRFIAQVEASIRSIAVLPLDNLSGDANLEYWADGMSDELINHLAKITGLKVISRTSIMGFKRRREPLPDIARQLSVDALIEGSVMISGQRARIRVQLVHAASDSHLWAESYDCELSDAPRLHVRVAQDIAHHVRSRLIPKGRAPSPGGHLVSATAYEAYLKGRFFWNKRTEADLIKSAEYFKQAVSLESTYSLAYCGLADSYIMMGVFALYPPHDVYPQARIAVERALELDRNLAEPHAALAMIRLQYDWDWTGAEQEFQKAIELNPNYSVVHQWYAYLLAVLGRHEEALAQVQRAREIDPLSLPINAFVGFIHMKSRHCSEAIDACRKAIELDPPNPFGHWMLARAFDACDQFHEALVESENAATVSGGSLPYVAHLGYAHARNGDRAKAEQALSDLMELSGQKYVSPYDFAVIHAAVGNNDEAFKWLEKAYEQRTSRLTELADPGFKALRADPRFQPLRRCIGLP